MAKSLGGSLLIRNGNKYDYPYLQAIKCLLEFCDKVVVCCVPTDDWTNTEIHQEFEKEISKGLLFVRVVDDSIWNRMEFQTKHRLSIFTNYAIEMLDTDYVFNLQGDEIVTPDSYQWIRKAIEEGEEGYMCTRINLWKDPFHMLNVPHSRKPCSTEINRLTKTCYRAYDDAESLASPTTDKYLDKIKIIHYGFVRKKEVHPEKIRHMQRDVFLVEPDKKLEGMVDFEWDKWFSESDLLPFNEHPPLMQEWIKTRP